MRTPHAIAVVVLFASIAGVVSLDGQVRGGRRRAVATGEEGKGVAAGPRGVAVKGEEGYATAGRHGAAVKGDEGYAAVGRRGAVVAGEEGYASAGRYGGVVVGEEGYAAAGRRGVVVGERYESYEAWRVVAGVGAGIAIGTMLARPPTTAVTVSSGGSSYWYDNGVFYTRVIANGSTVYQVVSPPAGVVVTTLPTGCHAVQMSGVAYSQCGTTYFQRVSNGYRVVVF